jgi:IS30 family transposase
MQDATALGAANAFFTLYNKVVAQMRLSFTYDQGREMAADQHLTHITGMQVYLRIRTVLGSPGLMERLATTVFVQG